MYVCLCRQVTDRAIRRAIAEGADSLEALQAQLGVCLECGRCTAQVEALLQEARGQRRPEGQGEGMSIPASPPR
jgi:bacterioferritin-associated ferredoxin